MMRREDGRGRGAGTDIGARNWKEMAGELKGSWAILLCEEDRSSRGVGAGRQNGAKRYWRLEMGTRMDGER